MSAALKLPAVNYGNDNAPVPAIQADRGAMLIHIVNPMVPQLDARRLADCEGMTVTEAVARAGWTLSDRTVLVRDNLLVLRTDWDCRLIAYGELVLLVDTYGGGKGGASQVFALIATIALALVAPEIGAALLGDQLFAEVAFAGITFGQLATVGIVLLGTTLIHALLPKPKPMATSDSQTSPTYSLSAQSNSARLDQVIPERGGRFRFLPDLSTQAFFDFINNKQELCEEFCLGIGEFEIEEVGVLNNPIWTSGGGYTGTYPELELLFMPPGTANTLFSNNVVTSNDISNVEMPGTNEDGGGADVWSAPVVLNPSDTLAHEISVDISIPGGLFSVDDKENLKSAAASFIVQVREIDDAGDPVDGAEWDDIITEAINMATRDPVRITYSADLTPGRYQERHRRSNARSTDLRTSDQMFMLAMRGYLPNLPARSDVTCIALKATSTKNLNGDGVQKFYVIATRKLPLYDRETATWSAPTATRSIAAFASYVCRSQNDLRKADNQIDLDRLWALDDIWTARGDYFDGVFDTEQSGWAMLQAVLRCGRAEPLRAGRQVTFNRDEPKAVPRATFNPTNMLAGSFNIDYVIFAPGSTDAVWIDYIDARNWQPASVFCALAGSVTSQDDAPHISFLGIVDRDHGWREGVFIVAVNVWRRRFPNWRTEMEGRVCLRGDKIQVAHWLPKWGAAGQIVYLDQDEGGDILTLSEPWNSPQPLNDDTKLATLTTPDGRAYGPVAVELLDDGEESGMAVIRMLETATVTVGRYAGQQPRDWDVFGDDGANYERPRISWGTATQKALDALVVMMKPESGNNVTMAAVIDDQRVHYVDGTIPPLDPGDETPSPPPEDTIPAPPANDDLVISDILLREIDQAGGLLQPTIMGVTVTGAPHAASFEAQWKWNDASDYGPLVPGLGRTFQIPTVTGALTMQVRAKGLSGFGDWFTKTFAASGVPISGSEDVASIAFGIITDAVFVAGSVDGAWHWDAATDALGGPIEVTGYIVQVVADGVPVHSELQPGLGYEVFSDGTPYAPGCGSATIRVKVVTPTGTTGYFDP